jgi:DNA-binding NarL/FixJ family response regulator
MSTNLTKADFTNREIEILALLAQGANANAIAEKLYLSPDTIKTHKRNVLRKTQAPNTIALVVHCVRMGWL